MIRLFLFILISMAAVSAKPAGLGLLPGALPETFSSRYFPFKEIGEGRIISGSPASRGQFPWQAALYLTLSAGSSFCGGSLISSHWILTAAHCVQGVRAVTAYLGVVSLNDPSRVTASASRAIVHPSYSSSTLQNDIALLQLSTSVSTSSNYISTIRLATTTLGSGISVRVSGWGRTSDGSSSISQTLNWVSLTTISNPVCQQSYGSIITSGIVCARGTTIQSTCNGDSGGPLVTGTGSSAVQVGIVSFVSSAGCASGYPSAYTRIAAYRNWISSNSGV